MYGRVVRYCEIKAEQSDERADQPLGLTQCQTEYRLQCQRRRDCQALVAELVASHCPWFGLPGRDRLLRKPNRQAAALAQAGIILAPVRDLVPLSGDVVTVVGMQLETHDVGSDREGITGLPCLEFNDHQADATSRAAAVLRSVSLG